jgi:hypothetical protein
MNVQKYRYEDSRSAVLKHILSEGLEPLTDAQVLLMERWRAADELIRSQKYRREEVAIQLMAKFEISRMTAFNDMTSAEWVFSSSAPLNKVYEIGLRIEFIKERIAIAAGKIPYKKDKDGKDLFHTEVDEKAIAMHEKNLQGYYDMYPTLRDKPKPSKTVFIVKGNMNVAVMEKKDALQQAEQIVLDITEQNEQE